MRSSNKLLSLVLTLTMLFSLSVTVSAADTTTDPAAGDIVVLYTNDVHCAVDGYATLAAYRADMLAKTDYVTLVDAGDAIQGEALGTLSKGQYPVDIMNQVGYDVIIPGNHEFDYGMDQFLTLAKSQANGYVCCNFVDLRTGKAVFDSYKMITYGSTKVAYVGIDTPEAISKSTPTYFQDGNGNYIYGFCQGNDGKDLYNAVQTAVNDAKAAGADYVIALGHCGIDEQSAPWRSTDIIANVSGLTAFIDGHSHSTIPSQTVADKDGKTVLLTSTGTKLANIGKLVIKANGSVTTGLVSTEDYTKKDATVDTFVAGIEAKNEALLKTVVAKTSVDLTTKDPSTGNRAVRNAETNLGDLCADAYRAIGNADVALVNGGGIRADIAAGDITYEQIIAVHPYGNELCVVEATGQQILDALEMTARSNPGENGGFLQVSGLTYTIDQSIPSSVKVDDNKMFVAVEGEYRVKDVKIGGKAIDLNATYTVASHNYMLKDAGDGINMFQNNKFVMEDIMLDNQVLITYITENLNGSVPAEYAEPQGRITITGEPFDDVTVDQYFYAGVVYAYQNKLFNGTTSTTFTPYGTMTRGQLAAVLYRMAGSPAVDTTASFSDVASDAYYAKAVAWAAQTGITGGYEDGTFRPGQAITRQQFAAFLYRYAQAMKYDVTTGANTDISGYGDAATVSNYAQAAVQWAVGNGLIQGNAGRILPTGTATRGQVAVILQRFAANVSK